MPRHRVGANAPPDDRLQRGIPYAAVSSPKHERFWNIGSPGQAGRRRRREWLFDIQTETRGLPRGARNDVERLSMRRREAFRQAFLMAKESSTG
jgi:hypothetical protein